ncbi:hypothetical protein RRV45_15020 [Bacillus sp. DTU_2020_1000418_1_SI_GHA_SEK_038]|uniref:hypothetical protein n=1 Tax=Bacillus sp. DTU_2020_1000418_1_SI_GHA_SEK_038 TaxID=3077585 RepID=UPI0028EAED54|nr:hypothetical protein [Bacillus sp. DTU_2020_1000418_1_SI_GHA_SEK_038]WNS74221.1 hypothetical protein RRV45_15020 [Bacillus sp. DTU_2020_1000418_1_SI_GHA_SEK_038]
MFKRKETMSIKQFMNKEHVMENAFCAKELASFEKVESMGWLATMTSLPLIFAPAIKAKEVFAAEVVPVMASAELSSKLMTAFGPIIDLVQALAYPVGMVVVLGGAIMVMIGQQEKGYSMLMSAGLGIILINIAPMVLNVLIGAMKSVV